jgi:hypothetical protein
MPTTLSDLSPDELASLTESIRTLHEIHSRRLSDAALLTWVELLASQYGPELLRTLKDACRMIGRMPSPGEILETVMAAKRRSASIEAARISFADMVRSAETPEAKRAAEEALAILRAKFG